MNVTQQTIVNQPTGGGFGVVQVDRYADGVHIVFVGVGAKGHVEDRVDERTGELVHGVAANLLAQAVGYPLRFVA